MPTIPTHSKLPENKLRRVTIKEACVYGRMAKSKLYQLIAAGRIDAYKDGHSTLIDLNSIDRYQENLPKIVLRRKAP